jgi:hypothetical protein
VPVKRQAQATGHGATGSSRLATPEAITTGVSVIHPEIDSYVAAATWDASKNANCGEGVDGGVYAV